MVTVMVTSHWKHLNHISCLYLITESELFCNNQGQVNDLHFVLVFIWVERSNLPVTSGPFPSHLSSQQLLTQETILPHSFFFLVCDKVSRILEIWKLGRQSLRQPSFDYQMLQVIPVEALNRQFDPWIMVPIKVKVWTKLTLISRLQLVGKKNVWTNTTV